MTRHITVGFAGLVAAALSLAAPAARAAAHVHESAAIDTIRGVVFDSLLHQPLTEATVQADAGAISTQTDREGRFELISPTPIKRVSVFHDFLDRSGLGSLVAVIDAKTSRSMLVLSTPSLATIWARVCPANKPLEKGRGGIVFGVARTSDGKTRVSGATVRVSWDFDAPSASGIAARISDAKTDTIGAYYACGAPPNSNVYAFANSATLRSGSINIPGDSLPLRRADLVLGEVGKTAALRGIVLDARKTPLKGATIDIDGSPITGRTDGTGRFILTNVPTGSRAIIVRALGYTPTMWPVDVLDRNPEELQIDVVEQALPGVKVTGKQQLSSLHMEIDQRRRAGFGTIKDSTEIVKHTSIRSIFQGIPSLVITGKDESSFGLFTPGQSMSTDNPAGGCPANVYIDGFQSDLGILITLPKAQIAAIEVYIRQEFAPGRYLTLQNNCGVVLVWTKLQLKK